MYRIGQVVILTTSFLRTPVPCFAYIYEDYLLDNRKGYNLIALYIEEHGTMKYHLTNDLDGFSEQEMEDFTIPYIDKSHEYMLILSKLEFLKTKEGRDNRFMNERHRALKIIAFHYLNKDRLTTYIRDYNINQII